MRLPPSPVRFSDVVSISEDDRYGMMAVDDCDEEGDIDESPPPPIPARNGRMQMQLNGGGPAGPYYDGLPMRELPRRMRPLSSAASDTSSAAGFSHVGGRDGIQKQI